MRKKHPVVVGGKPQHAKSYPSKHLIKTGLITKHLTKKVEHSLGNCGAAPPASDPLLLRRPAEAQGGRGRGQAAGEAGGCHGLLFNMAGDRGWRWTWCVTL